jgi:uncharacterized protein (TIGR02117 family)
MSLLKKSAIIFTLPILFITLYFSLSKLLVFFPTKVSIQKDTNHSIHILYGDIHTDIVFSLNDLNPLWFKHIQAIKGKKEGYIGIGWGDKASYLHPGTYDTIPLTVIFKALFINTPSVIHVNYYEKVQNFQNIKSIKLSERQLNHLTKSIFNDFNFQAESHKGYNQHDYFYSSPKSYNIINTCNTYTGDKLRESNISMSYWTPLKENVIDSLP